MADRKPLLHRALFARGSWSETARITTILRKETVGGALLLFAAAVALIWANSRWSASYHNLTNFHVGTDRFGLHLDLSLGRLGRGRPAGDLLLRRRARTQAGVRRRRPA